MTGEERKNGGVVSKNTLKDNGVHLLMDNINSITAKTAIQWILEENLKTENRREFLTMIIDSPGGYIVDCLALIDIMKGSKIPIRTVGIGLIASCGLLIFLAGEKGHRVLTPNTMILSHQFSGGAYGKEHELVAAQKANKLYSKKVMDHYRKTTGLSEKQIRIHLLPPQDTWLSPREAKKLKLCDQIKEVY